MKFNISFLSICLELFFIYYQFDFDKNSIIIYRNWQKKLAVALGCFDSANR